jgi:hypothetical protein
MRGFAKEMRQEVDARSSNLHAQGERLIDWMTDAYERRAGGHPMPPPPQVRTVQPAQRASLVPYRGLESLQRREYAAAQAERGDAGDLFGIAPGAIAYDEFKRQMAEMEEEGR